MAVEYRKKIYGLNFVGGKRDFCTESSYQTASREFIEETGFLLTKETQEELSGPAFEHSSPNVAWNPSAKLALYVR